MARYIVLLALIMTALSGCKLHVISLQGGQVQSGGSGICLEQTNCVHTINDTSYNETFTAAPASSHHFVKWYEGPGFLCGNSTNLTCVVDLRPFAGIVPDAVIAAGEDVYLMPIFKEGQEVTDTVIVDNKEWAQPAHFTDLSWDELNLACQPGPCSGLLNGFDVDGYEWASLADVASLFNHYIGSPLVGVPGLHAALDTTWAPAFLNDFIWTRETVQSMIVAGWTGSVELPSEEPYFAEVHDNALVDGVDRANAFETNPDSSYKAPTLGAWLYRPVP